MESDEKWMRAALHEAAKAAANGEVPVGAVAVQDNRIIARGHNVREATCNPLGHAELLLVQKLSKKLRAWRLSGVTLYVTLEPCLMCMGALLQARIDRLVFATFDPKAGACGSLFDLSQDKRLNHRIPVTAGVLKAEASQMLSEFFRNLRKLKSQLRQ